MPPATCCISDCTLARVESEEIAPGIVLDYDEDNSVVGIEITDGSKIADLTHLEVQGLATALLKQPAR